MYARFRLAELELAEDRCTVGQVSLEDLNAVDDSVQAMTRGAWPRDDRDFLARGDQLPDDM